MNGPNRHYSTRLGAAGHRRFLALLGLLEFDSAENAQNYIDNLLIPVTKKLGGNLSVKLFNGDVVAEASQGMQSPYYQQE